MSPVPSQKYDVIVVGGGPSGMMAAGFAAARGRRVLLIEKNERLGDKLKVTGGGRCNITNAEEDRERLLRHYGIAKDFLYSPFSLFGVKDTFTFFEKRGLPLVVQERKRTFPATERAEDVFRVLEIFIREEGVVVRTDSRVTKILTKEGEITGVQVGKEKLCTESLVLATGGLSHPELGASGDGFAWLRSLGHQVQEPSPDIVPLAVRERWVKEISGSSLSFMKITFFCDGVKQFSKKGKILFTHFGLSGPLILNSAREVKSLLRSGVVTAQIDAYPDTDLGHLEKNLIKIFDAHKNKTLKNVLPEIAPHGLAPALTILLSSLGLDTKVHSITKEYRHRIAILLKAFPLTITRLMGFDRAVVSDGGVLLTEMDLKTMRSRIHPNLYITGDLLNITRPSGGFSLQLCWTTGYIAGQNA